MPRRDNDPQRAQKAATREARARDAALAMRDYHAELLAVRARTARLRALRLAKEAREATEKFVSLKEPLRTTDAYRQSFLVPANVSIIPGELSMIQ
jgi:hypothetical protein